MSTLRNSERLKVTIELASSRLGPLAESFWSHDSLPELLPGYLFQLYSSMRASVPLMEVGRQRALELADSCPVAAAVADYLEHHIKEELHHDEWLLEDMGLLGMDREEVLARMAPTEVVELIGSLYYWIFHAHPLALLAYFAVVEGNPITVEALEGILARYDIPRAALRTFFKHAELDVKHGEDVFRFLDTLELTPAQSALLGLSATQVVGHLGAILERALAAAPIPATSLEAPTALRT